MHPLVSLRSVSDTNRKQHTEWFYSATGDTSEEPSNLDFGEWRVGFTLKDGWPAVEKHVEDCLLANGYTILVDRTADSQINAGRGVKGYLSADKQLVLGLKYQRAVLEPRMILSDGFEYSVIKLPAPMSDVQLKRLLEQ